MVGGTVHSAWYVVMAARAELERQQCAVSKLSEDGVIVVSGMLDLAALTNAIEIALHLEFGK